MSGNDEAESLLQHRAGTWLHHPHNWGSQPYFYQLREWAALEQEEGNQNLYIWGGGREELESRGGKVGSVGADPSTAISRMGPPRADWPPTTPPLLPAFNSAPLPPSLEVKQTLVITSPGPYGGDQGPGGGLMPVGYIPALPPPHSHSCVAYVLPLRGEGVEGGGKFHLCVSSTYRHGPRAWPDLPTL